jgi:branched-chain amino acid transport system substrate-binding protein
VKPRTSVLPASLLGLALIAAACGGDDGGSGGDDVATAATIDESVKAGVEQALNSSTTAAAGPTTTAPAKVPTSMEEWEQLWEQERAAVVKKLKDANAGVSADGKTATGLGGFTIDLSKCPAGWSDTEGLSDTEIKIGHTNAQSGTLAIYGDIAKSILVQYDAVNKAGGITDSTGKTRTINVIVKDDGYDPARTIPLVDELLDSEKVFAVWTLGSPNIMKTYDKVNQRCVPQPVSFSGHPAWGDPVNHPWTTGSQLAYNTEAVLWGAFIEKHIDELAVDGGKAVIAGLIMNNDFGKSYESGMKAFLAQSPMKDRIDFVFETIEPTAPTITDPMTTLASKNPSMFIAMTAWTSCTQAIQEAAQNGMAETVKYRWMPSVCSGKNFIGKEAVGEAGNGWWIVNGGLKDISSEAFDDDPYIQFARQQLADGGLDYKVSAQYGNGYFYGPILLQGLLIAAELDGGLTRTNLMIALRALDFTHPYLLEGIKLNMNGNEDAYPVEGGVYQTRDTAAETWVNQGAVIELSGKSQNCAWNQSTSSCG